MTAEYNHLQYGEQRIEYRVVRRQRKTLEIAVNPDASVVITAPMDASIKAIEQKLRKRAAWVTRQQRYFTQLYSGRNASLSWPTVSTESRPVCARKRKAHSQL